MLLVNNKKLFKRGKQHVIYLMGLRKWVQKQVLQKVVKEQVLLKIKEAVENHNRSHHEGAWHK